MTQPTPYEQCLVAAIVAKWIINAETVEDAFAIRDGFDALVDEEISRLQQEAA